MKEFILTYLFGLIGTLCIFAQAPKVFKYQTVIRDNTNNLITNQSVSFKIGIVQDSINGPLIYSETHSVVTNQFGLVSLAIGSGDIELGFFSDINWGTASYYLKLELDETGNTNYQFIGVTEIISVPYSINSSSLTLTSPGGEKYEVLVDDFGNLITPCTSTSSPSTIGPVFVSDIVNGYWQNSNHSQGICFTSDALVISCTKQLIKWNLAVREIVDERLCSNIPAGCDSNFHYGDIAAGNGDLWIAYHEGPWEEIIDCDMNRIARFENEVINEQYTPLIYNVDYQGHIGAIELVGNKIYVSGKYIPNDYSGEDCFNPLVIYIYDIDSLYDTINCNLHEDSISINVNGRWGIQALTKLDEQNLLVAPYGCPDYNENYVYKVNLVDGFYTTTIFCEENWGYGFSLDQNGKIFVCDDNRNKDVFYVREFIE